MTIREKYGVLKGLKMCYIGDGNNMANSLIVGGLKSDMQVSIATPDNYRPAKEVLDFAAGNDAFTLVNDPIKAVENADVVITDTWTSMGQEEEKKIRQQAFQGYQINDELMAAAKPGAMVMHCLPAYRGQEITRRSLKNMRLRSLKRRKTGCMPEGGYGYADEIEIYRNA